MTTHLAIPARMATRMAAGMSLVLGVTCGTALAQGTSSTTTTADQRTEKSSSAATKANAAAAKTGKRWDGLNLKPVDERANARQGAPGAVRDAPTRSETGTGCHSKADDV